MKNIKKILTIILSISLLFLVSCGNDNKTGSDSGGGTIPSTHRDKYYKSVNHTSSGSEQIYMWLYINNDGNIQYTKKASQPTSTDFINPPVEGSFSGNTFTCNFQGANIKLEFKSDFSSVTVSGAPDSIGFNGEYTRQ